MMKYIRKLPAVEDIIFKYALTEAQKQNRKNIIKEIEKILSGKSTKKIICIGPCSADREDAILDYISRLAKLQERMQDKFLFIPRVYTSKPRTTGKGYKGLFHRPISSCNHDDILGGVIAMRKIHLHVIQQTGMFCADEMLYPETLQYLLDLLVYIAIGARSVEDQGHRLVASGVEIPVGMKNPTSGDTNILLNAITAAQYPQTLLFGGWEVETDGNLYAHAILRGYSDLNGNMHPNYHYENLCELYDNYQKQNLKNIAVLIDCNHSNSKKQYTEQERIAKDVFYNCRTNQTLNQFIKGIIVESYLEDGAQMIGEGIYGKSITDACIGWEKTANLLEQLYDMPL